MAFRTDQSGGCLRDIPRGADRVLDEAILSAKRGDPSGLHFLYLRYGDNLCRYVKGIVRDADEAEDITHNVFAKVMTAILQFDPDSAPFAAWIFTVARNAAIDELRRKRPVPYEDVHLPDRAPGDERDVSLALRAALQELPDSQRKVVLLRHLMGLSTPEIAEMLGKTEGSVNGLQHRGRGALRAALTELGAAPAAVSA
jgi:RNA polymerase sigma-70 factor (ECF subfamily)